jgi:hypothetical protein
MLPRHPSHPPITEPIIWSSIVATRRAAAGSLIKRVNPSTESLTPGAITAATCHICNNAASSSRLRHDSDHLPLSGDREFERA